MTMTTTSSFLADFGPCWSLAAGCAVVLAVLAGGVSPLPAQSIACMVNGEPITSLDIEQRTKLNFLTTRKQMPRQEVLDELINEKVKIKEAKKFGVDPSASDVDQAYTGMSQRMRYHARTAHQIAGEPGCPAGNAEGPPQGRDGLGQPGARPLQGKPASRRERRCGRRRAKRRTDPDRGVRIQAAADRADRAARLGTSRDRPAAQGSRILARARPDLRAGQLLLQVDAECRDPRDRHQDLGRHSRPAS